MLKAEIVSRITYKPGWEFSATEEKLTIEFDVEDSRGGGPLHLRFDFPWDPSYRWYTADYVWDRIQVIERHEAKEWFRVEGRLVHDPHTTTTEEFRFIDKRLV